MYMSVARNFESVSRYAKFLSTLSVPMNVWGFFSIISVTTASVSLPLTLAATVTRTRSPLRACMEFRSATKICSPSGSVRTLFLPFERRWKIPSAGLDLEDVAVESHTRKNHSHGAVVLGVLDSNGAGDLLVVEGPGALSGNKVLDFEMEVLGDALCGRVLACHM